MTWMEIADALKQGKTTIIIPTGGVEQTGPHLVTGKHNFILQYTAKHIAEGLKDALVGPTLPVVPEGNITPPEGHMAFAGTVSLSRNTFAALLEDVARSFKQHGFKTICFIGEHGASQDVQKTVAEKLTEEWKADGVRVIHVNEYYDEHNGQSEALAKIDEKDQNPQAHGGLADTSEMLFAYPQGVRKALTGHHDKQEFATLGVDGASDHATAAIGKEMLSLKIKAAVRQIERERGHP